MKDDDISRLFMSVTQGEGETNDDVRQVFSTLVRSTLQYRDQMLKDEGIVVTVGDVRAVLDRLVPALTTGRLPPTENKVRLDLLKLWLDALKPFRNSSGLNPIIKPIC